MLTRFLDGHGVRVPKLLADLPESQAYATAFVEGKDLETLANEKGADLVKLYLPTLDVLKSLWAVPVASGVPELEPAFGPELYAWERELFERECVKGRYGLDGLPAEAVAELEKVSAVLCREPQMLVHRDFQSANLIYPQSGGKPYLIDYQGLRFGAAAYDVASLLFDPYVPMDGTDRKMLLELAAKMPNAPSAEVVTLAAVQRLCQALGAYCRLVSVGQTRFGKYILRALGNLHHALHEAGLPALADFSHRLIEREKIAGGV